MQTFWLNYKICDLLILILNTRLLSSAIIYFRAAISKEPASLNLTFLSCFVTKPIMIKTKVRFFPKATQNSRASLCDAKNTCGINKPAAGLHVSHLVVELPEGRRKL